MTIDLDFALSAIQIMMPFTEDYEVEEIGPEEYRYDSELYEYRVKRTNNVPSVCIRFKPTRQLSMVLLVKPGEDYRKAPCAILNRKLSHAELVRLPDYII